MGCTKRTVGEYVPVEPGAEVQVAVLVGAGSTEVSGPLRPGC